MKYLVCIIIILSVKAVCSRHTTFPRDFPRLMLCTSQANMLKGWQQLPGSFTDRCIESCSCPGMICRRGSTCYELVSLDIQGFQMSSPIPSDISALNTLEVLELPENYLTGPIPSAICFLSNLERLHLGRNMLTSMPDCIGDLSSLTYLNIEYNLLDGRIRDSFCGLASLEYLSLKYNHFNGWFYSFPVLPSCLDELPLTFCDISENPWVTTNPIGIEGICYESLLNDDQLVLWNWRALFDRGSEMSWTTDCLLNCDCGGLHCNSDGRITTLAVSGIGDTSEEIPNEITTLSELTYLRISENRLQGTIPPSISALTNLEELRLHNNLLLNGELPEGLCELPQLKYFAAWGNLLEGSVPDCLSSLDMIACNLVLNQFDIPAELEGTCGGTWNGCVVTPQTDDLGPLGP